MSKFVCNFTRDWPSGLSICGCFNFKPQIVTNRILFPSHPINAIKTLVLDVTYLYEQLKEERVKNSKSGQLSNRHVKAVDYNQLPPQVKMNNFDKFLSMKAINVPFSVQASCLKICW